MRQIYMHKVQLKQKQWRRRRRWEKRRRRGARSQEEIYENALSEPTAAVPFKLLSKTIAD